MSCQSPIVHLAVLLAIVASTVPTVGSWAPMELIRLMAATGFLCGAWPRMEASTTVTVELGEVPTVPYK